MKIGIKNLRSLKDTSLIEIKPLTFLLGQNSSGKSTFLRSFPLLRQSVETRTKGPILWYGNYVDFGDFGTALSENAEENSIFFEFEIELDFSYESYHSSFRFNSLSRRAVSNTKKIGVSIKLSHNKNFTFASEVLLKYSGINCCIKIDDNTQAKVYVDGQKLDNNNFRLLQVTDGLVPQLLIHDKERLIMPDSKFLKEEKIQIIKQIVGNRLAESTIGKIINSFSINDEESFYKSIINSKESQIFKNKVKDLTREDDTYKKLKTVVFSSMIPLFLVSIDAKLSNIFRKVNYIGPVRATAERYYRPQDLRIDEVDFQGKNLALVLANFSESEKNKFRKFCVENFKFYPEATNKGGNISIVINFESDSYKHNITDLGFGFSQLLPIITQIWGSVMKRNHKYRDDDSEKLFVIEQPELHLHPKMQGKFLNAVIGILHYCRRNDVKVNFVIETHSETLINGIGNRIYKKSISEDDVNVIVFNREENNSTVKVVKFDENGRLMDWPFGFFDEY